MVKRFALFACAAMVLGLLAPASAVSADPVSGAIFTTLPDGSAVNFNIYPSKDQVYLDGGPGDHAPPGAAGLPPGTYVFQVTDPSGKTLLSQDAAQCREFVVGAQGFITGVVATGCQHATGIDADHGADGAVTVQLIPYADTPNPGGEYKVWATPIGSFTCSLTGPDCGGDHGFDPDQSKTDNFKVKSKSPVEIDTTFHRASDGVRIDGLEITWTDTLGASNHKWSYFDSGHLVQHQAHVEGVEPGTHKITVANQSGCTIGKVTLDGVSTGISGPQTVNVNVKKGNSADSYYVDVECTNV